MLNFVNTILIIFPPFAPVPVIKKTWEKEALFLEYYSDHSDPSIPTINLGVPNTERGEFFLSSSCALNLSAADAVSGLGLCCRQSCIHRLMKNDLADSGGTLYDLRPCEGDVIQT